MTSFGKHYFLAKSSRHVQNNEAHLLGPKTAIIFLGVVMGKVLHFSRSYSVRWKDRLHINFQGELITFMIISYFR